MPHLQWLPTQIIVTKIFFSKTNSLNSSYVFKLSSFFYKTVLFTLILLIFTFLLTLEFTFTYKFTFTRRLFLLQHKIVFPLGLCKISTTLKCICVCIHVSACVIVLVVSVFHDSVVIKTFNNCFILILIHAATTTYFIMLLLMLMLLLLQLPQLKPFYCSSLNKADDYKAAGKCSNVNNSSWHVSSSGNIFKHFPRHCKHKD